MRFDVAPAPHLLPTRRVIAVMAPVALALVPAGLVHLLCFGPGLLFNLLSTVTVALLSDRLGSRWLGNPSIPKGPLGDGSALVSAVLIAFCLPPLTSVWVSASAAAIAIVLGKQCFGGLGKNPFNPAMVGYGAVVLAFPAQLAGYPAEQATLAQTAFVFLGGLPSSLDALDAVSGATPLDTMQSGLRQMLMVSEIRAHGDVGMIHGARWDLLSLAFLVGGLALFVRRIITWHAPVGMAAGVLVTAAVLAAGNPDGQAGALFHLAAPSSVLAAFFIATDPVSGATSPPGRFVFGVGIGMLAVLIRSLGAYPDGIAFAVLLMNLAVPLIDHWTRPRVVGNVR